MQQIESRANLTQQQARLQKQVKRRRHQSTKRVKKLVVAMILIIMFGLFVVYKDQSQCLDKTLQTIHFTARRWLEIDVWTFLAFFIYVGLYRILLAKDIIKDASLSQNSRPSDHNERTCFDASAKQNISSLLTWIWFLFFAMRCCWIFFGFLGLGKDLIISNCSDIALTYFVSYASSILIFIAQGVIDGVFEAQKND